MTSKRLDYLDIAKAIGIILVVLYHFLQGVPTFTDWISSFHMPLFFVISGYLLYGHTCFSVKTFIVKKAKSIMWPYLTFSVIALVWACILKVVFSSNIDPIKEILFRIISLYGQHALWFLPTLFFAEILFYHLITQSKGKRTAAFVALALISCLLYLYISGKEVTRLVMALRVAERAVIAVFYLLFGYLLHRYRFFGNLYTRIISIAAAAIISFLPIMANGLCNFSAIRFGNPIIYAVKSLLLCPAVISVSYFIGKLPKALIKPITYVGKNSMIIMALHMEFPIEIAFIILSRFTITNNILSSSVAILICLAINIALIPLLNKKIRFITKFPQKTGVEKTK